MPFITERNVYYDESDRALYTTNEFWSGSGMTARHYYYFNLPPNSKSIVVIAVLRSSVTQCNHNDNL